MNTIIRTITTYILCIATTLAFISCSKPSTPDDDNIYKIDLSKLPASNEEKTATYDNKTGIITINRQGDEKADAGIFYWLNNMDVSAYNIIRIKYEALDEFGFNFFVFSDRQVAPHGIFRRSDPGL